MNAIYDFFATPSIATTVLYLCLTAFTGVLFGKLEVKGIKLGIAGVLFTGIFIAHPGAPIDAHILHFIRCSDQYTQFGCGAAGTRGTRCQCLRGGRNRHGLRYCLSLWYSGHHYDHVSTGAAGANLCVDDTINR